MFNEEKFKETISRLESLDKSFSLKHIPRKDWTPEMVKGKVFLWQIPRTTAQFIYSQVILKKPSLVLELGTSGGYSTLWIAKAVNDSIGESNASIHTIEFSEDRFNIAKENFENVQTENIIQHQGKIEPVIKSWSDEGFGKIDFLFIDADRPAYTYHFRIIEPNLNKGALIIADNILDKPEKAQEFVDYMMNNSDFYSTVFDFDNGLLFAIKK